MADRIAHAIVDTGRQPWQARAACQNSPGLMDCTTGPEVSEALKLCRFCPVKAQCEQWVTSEPDYAGVAAGAVYTEKRHRRRHTLPKAG